MGGPVSCLFQLLEAPAFLGLGWSSLCKVSTLVVHDPRLSYEAPAVTLGPPLIWGAPISRGASSHLQCPFCHGHSAGLCFLSSCPWEKEGMVSSDTD